MLILQIVHMPVKKQKMLIQEKCRKTKLINPNVKYQKFLPTRIQVQTLAFEYQVYVTIM